MRVMVFAKTTEDSDKGAAPTPEAFAAMDRFIEELVKAGVFVAGAGLKNSAQAKRIGEARSQSQAGPERGRAPAVPGGGGSCRVHGARGALDAA